MSLPASCKNLPEVARLLLIVDQFEGCTHSCQGGNTPPLPRYAAGGMSASQPDQPVSLPYSRRLTPCASSITTVITLRADFLGQALAYRLFADALDKANELLGPMNPGRNWRKHAKWRAAGVCLRRAW